MCFKKQASFPLQSKPHKETDESSSLTDREHFFSMMKDNKNSGFSPTMLHKCSRFCLGPLTFHSQAVGDKIRLSEGGRHAERSEDTFRDGLLFSSRPVRINEKIRVRVLRHVPYWKGALRVGFTNQPPWARSLPLPGMAIPDLTDGFFHWAAPVNESFCHAGSVVEFWVSSKGKLHCSANGVSYKLLSGVDLSQPLWAMIDVYGQTCSIFLMGSEKKHWPYNKTSCPSPEALTIPYTSCSPEQPGLGENADDCLNMEIPAGSSCVACMVREPTTSLSCGHRCLCHHCTSKVLEHFGTCPLCRQEITSFS